MFLLAIGALPLFEELLDSLRDDWAAAALGLPVQGHAVLLWLVAALAVGSRLSDDVSVAVDGLSDEALAAGDVAAVRVGVDQPRLGLLPLPEAAVLALFKHLRLVVAAVDGVEHDLRVVAVGVGAGAEAVRVGDDARVLAHQRAVRRVLDRLPTKSQPLGRAEVLDGAEREV